MKYTVIGSTNGISEKTVAGLTRDEAINMVGYDFDDNGPQEGHDNDPDYGDSNDNSNYVYPEDRKPPSPTMIDRIKNRLWIWWIAR